MVTSGQWLIFYTSLTSITCGEVEGGVRVGGGVRVDGGVRGGQWLWRGQVRRRWSRGTCSSSRRVGYWGSVSGVMKPWRTRKSIAMGTDVSLYLDEITHSKYS